MKPRQRIRLPVPVRRTWKRTPLRYRRISVLTAIVFAGLVISWCGREHRPSRTDDVCIVFSERPNWYRSAYRAQERWGISIPIQLAIIAQESGLDARARPPRARWWIFPGNRSSSAFGYAQALDSTWEQYRQEAGRRRAKRGRFHDATDFIGWYCSETHRLTGVAKDDPHSLYLAYHQGAKGFLEGSYRENVELLTTARRVADRSELFQRQLRGCESELIVRNRWRIVLLTILVGGTVSGIAILLQRRRKTI